MNGEKESGKAEVAVDSGWSLLPTELLCLILSFDLDIKTLISATSVNSQWHSASAFPELWRDALINEKYLPSNAAKLKDVKWREYVQSYAQTKRNMQKKLMVIDTLATSHADTREWYSSFERTALMSRTTWGRWAAITRFKVSQEGDRLLAIMAGDLWDLDGRTLLQKFPNMHVIVAAGYLLIVKTAKNVNGGDVFSLKYDTMEAIKKLAGQSIRVSKTVSFFKMCDVWDLKTIHNKDDTSPYACFYYRRSDRAGQYVIRVFDLDQKKTVYASNVSVYVPIGLYGSTLVIFHETGGYGYVYPDILHPNVTYEAHKGIIHMESPTVAWKVSGRQIIKTDISTKTDLDRISLPDYCPVGKKITTMTIFQNMAVIGLKNQFIVFVGLKTKQILRTINFGQQTAYQQNMDFHPLYSGKIAFMNSEHMSVISFLDKDVNQKVQMLKLKHGGKLEVVDVTMGKFHSMISQSKCFYYSMTFFHTDKWKRYSIVNNCIKGHKPLNKLATWLLQHRPNDALSSQLHKCEVFRQFFVDTKPEKITQPIKINKNLAFGTAWIFFEELKGTPTAWIKTTPNDNWQFVKDRLSATAVKQFVDSVMQRKKENDNSTSSEDDSSGDTDDSDWSSD